MALLSAVLVAALTHGIWLQAISSVLIEGERPVRSDAVVVLAGGVSTRALYGAQLVRDGWAPVLVLLDDHACMHAYCVRWSDLWRRGEVIDLDPFLPRSAIVPLLDDLPDMAEGTYEEATEAWQRLRVRGLRRLLLVTDDYHSRRAALTWRRAVGSEGQVVSTPARNPYISLDQWWRNRDSAKTVASEYVKLAGYVLTGRM